MKLKTKIIALASTAMLFVGSALGVGLSLGNAKAEEWAPSQTEWTWKEEYTFTSQFNVPAYEMTVNGETVASSSVVTYPDGSTTTETELVLDQAGNYTVSYYAASGGKEYVHTVSFQVKYMSYYVSSGQSSVEYGEYTAFDTVDGGYENEGLLVRLARGDSLEFSRIYDVAEFQTDAPLIKGFITPDAYDSPDFDQLTLTLTDALDPSIYLTIDLNRWWNTAAGSGKATSFVAAGGNGQDMVGYETGKGLHVNDNVGTPIFTSFAAVEYQNLTGSIGAFWSGTPVRCSPAKYPFTLTYDAVGNVVYAGSNVVSVLDSAEYYNTLWKGFPSGKARMSITADSYQSVTANFCLLSVLGIDDLENTDFEEFDAPEITVDTEYSKNMPNAKLGTAYKIPSAAAFDAYSGVCEVETKVWYNYASERPISVSVVNGTFTPDRLGYYSIVYTAKDVFGNAATEIYSVLSVSELPELTVACPEGVPTTATLGCKIALQEPIVAGGTGNKKYTVTVTGPDGSYEVEDSFTPNVAGKWTVTYTATDYIGTTATDSFELEATAGDKPVINETFNLPKIYMNGVSYVLPEIYAEDYSSGRCERLLCDVKLEYESGKVETKKAGESFVPSVATNGEKVKITYYKGDAALETVEVPVVIIKDGSSVFVQNYFYGENFEIVTKDADNKNLRGLQITATQVGDVGWTFANPQVADLFSVKLTSIKNLTRFSGLAINLTDAEDPDQSATLSIAVKGGSVEVSHGSFEGIVNISLNNDTIFTVAYANGKFQFENINVALETYDNGEAFEGFSSNKVYASVTMTDARVGAAYMVLEMSGSTVSYRNADFGDPNFTILGDYGGSYSIGDTYTLAPAIAGDTFAPSTELKVTVTDVNGNVVVDKNGLKLEKVEADKEYVIKLDTYGAYSIQYLATEMDWTGRSKEFTNYITVIDELAPEITVTSEYTRTVKVGETIVLPTFTVSDNITAAEAITVDKFVQNPTGRLVRIPGASNSVKATYEGTYILSIMAKDSYGNVTTVYFHVVVTK